MCLSHMLWLFTDWTECTDTYHLSHAITCKVNSCQVSPENSAKNESSFIYPSDIRFACIPRTFVVRVFAWVWSSELWNAFKTFRVSATVRIFTVVEQQEPSLLMRNKWNWEYVLDSLFIFSNSIVSDSPATYDASLEGKWSE